MPPALKRRYKARCDDDSPDHSGYFESATADEVKESDKDFIVVGEDPPLDDEDNTIPIRGFNNFAVYHAETKELVNIASLISERDSSSLRTYRASGFVTPWAGNSDFDFDELEADPDPGQMDVDSKIYIETKYGWYILEEPSAEYQPFFQNFWFTHKTTYFLLSESLKNPTVDKVQFLELLALHDEYSLSVLQRIRDGINDADVCAFALGSILELPVKINHVPLICQTFGEIPDIVIDFNDEDDTGPDATFRNIQSLETVVTQTVLQVCRRLFPQRHKFKICDNIINHPPPYHDLHTEVHSATPNITWQTKSSVINYYTSVIIDSTEYSIGDVVIVERGEDCNVKRDVNSGQEFSRSINTLANSKWFARISYMYEESNQKIFHGQWFQHGSQTVLQEAAHPSILFSMLECDDMPLESIVMKCNLISPRHNDESLLVDYDPQNENRFSCSLTWDEQNSAFVDFSEEQINHALQYCQDHKQCLSCGFKTQCDQFKSPQIIKPDLHFLGLTFRKHDFAYVANDSDDHLYTIGQILFIGDNLMVALRVYERCRNANKAFDELLLQSYNRIITVPAHKIEGLCWAKIESELSTEGEKRAWLSKEDHFVIVESDKASVVQGIGFRLHEQELQRQESLRKKNEPLRGLELFAGAGGFGTGLDLSGFVKTMWAVEWDSSAAATFRENHPETMVFNQNCNVFLAHAVQAKPLRLIDGDKSTLRQLPQPGDVDIIFGGPPCQAFSGMNHFRDPNDPRVTLVCNMISYVEYYRPKYFMLENVERMLDYPVGAKLDGYSLIGGIKKGVLKFILASLTSLGYQVHFKVLQAGRYSVPQNRERVIFLASKRGILLPKFPLPSHVFNRRATGKNLANGERLNPVSWAGENSVGHVCLCAPLPAVTVDDVLGDLPPFDWKDPHFLRSRRDDHLGARRFKSGIQKFDGVVAPNKTASGYLQPTPYLCSPITMYQARARNGVQDGKVALHYSRRYQAPVVERVVNVPLKPDADHSDLPLALQIGLTYARKNSDGGPGKFRRTYRRADGQRHIDTLITNPNPCSKGTTAIHPHQKRTWTVREYARLQGFPDNYKFVTDSKKSEVTQQFKQIGNAVPVPLAMALGRAIGKAVLQVWQQEEDNENRTTIAREESPEL